MPLPRLSNLQFIVLGALRAGPLTGRDIRARLAEFGAHKTGPGFYQLMSRLEEAGHVRGWYTQEIVGGQIIRERNYELLGSGEATWNESREFHLEVIERFGDVGEAARA